MEIAHVHALAPMKLTKLQFTPTSTASDKLDLKPGQDKTRIDSIRLRKDSDTRPLNPRHVVDLAESIAVLGLLEPIVIDTSGHLLAGGHRLAALQLLAESDPKERRAHFLGRCGWASKKADATPPPELASHAEHIAELGDAPLADWYPKFVIPVQVVDVSGRGGSERALAIEAAENNVRRQYSKVEITALAERFKAAGYKTTSGKPKAGERTMLSALEAAVGRSKRQIQRILTGEPTSEKSEWEKATDAFRRAAARVVKAGGRQKSDEARATVAMAEKVAKTMGG